MSDGKVNMLSPFAFKEILRAEIEAAGESRRRILLSSAALDCECGNEGACSETDCTSRVLGALPQTS